MPSTQKSTKSPAERNHELRLIAAKTAAAKTADQLKANDHARNQEAAATQVAVARETTKLELQKIKADNAANPEYHQLQGQLNLRDNIDHDDIEDIAVNGIDAVADLHDKAHGKLIKVGTQTTRNLVRSAAVKIDGIASRRGKKTLAVTAADGKTAAEVDTAVKLQQAMNDIAERGGRPLTPSRRGGGRLQSPSSLKKKANEKLVKESTEQRDMWFTGTYVPLSAHHVRGFHETIERHAAETGVRPNALIGITGKQKPPNFELPKIPYDCDDINEYLGHTMLHFNDYLKTNTPIELKMAVARAAHPELADKIHWVKDEFATSPVNGQVPKPGSIIVNDTLAKQAKDSPAYTPISTGKYQHNRHDLQIHMPRIQLDTEGEKLSTTPLRMTLIHGHSLRRQSTNPTFEKQLNELHSTMLGVPPNHPGVEQSKRMFDWMSTGWDAVKEAATQHYHKMRPDSITEAAIRYPNIKGDYRARVITMISKTMMDHLHSSDPNFDRMTVFHEYAKELPDYEERKKELHAFAEYAFRGRNGKIDVQLPFGPAADINRIRYLRGMKSVKYIDSLSDTDKQGKVPFGASGKIDGRSKITEDRRHAAGVGERLLRAQSLQSVGKRIGTKPAPPTNENTLMKRAKRAARYDLRKKLAPNYRNLSTGQKQDVDERIAKHAEFKKLVDTHYAQYKKKYAEKAHTSSHNKKPEHTK